MGAFDYLTYLAYLVGWGILFGGAVGQLPRREPEITLAMLLGGLLQLAITVLYSVVNLLFGFGVNVPVLVAELVLTLLVVILVAVNRRFASVPRGLMLLITALSLASIAVRFLENVLAYA